MTTTGPRLIEPSQTLDPRVVRLWTGQCRLATSVAVVVPAVVAVVLFLAGARTPALVLAAVAVVLGISGFLVSVLWPPRYFARYRWDVLPEGVVVAKGWLWRQLQVVPHSRIQAVDSSSGPWERRAGLASVHLRTASAQGSPKIPGLDAEVARGLAALIAERAGTDDAT